MPAAAAPCCRPQRSAGLREARERVHQLALGTPGWICSKKQQQPARSIVWPAFSAAQPTLMNPTRSDRIAQSAGGSHHRTARHVAHSAAHGAAQRSTAQPNSFQLFGGTPPHTTAPGKCRGRSAAPPAGSPTRTHARRSSRGTRCEAPAGAPGDEGRGEERPSALATPLPLNRALLLERCCCLCCLSAGLAPALAQPSPAHPMAVLT